MTSIQRPYKQPYGGCRAAQAQRNHIGMAIRAFLRLEHHRIRTDTSLFEAKMSILRPALQTYLSLPSPIVIGLAQSPAIAKVLISVTMIDYKILEKN